VIGVLSEDSEARAVQEFFQLFKTPWEFYTPRKKYDLVISTRDEVPEDIHANAVMIYRSRAIALDDRIGVKVSAPKKGGWLEWQDVEIPVYGDFSILQLSGRALIRCRQTSKIVGSVVAGMERPIVRVGFDLFSEVAFLLSQGQPAENSRIPTLDLHISLLRAIMDSLEVTYIEVPPVPQGYDFMGCLTHDVDFVGVRDHKFDHTMWGFLYRSTIGSLLKASTGRLSWSKCLRNWAAAFSLPLVHLGIRKDFWLEFDRYSEIEKECGSTYFFLPFKDVAGSLSETSAPKRRAAKYDLAEKREEIAKLLQEGCEVGLHGIDAWRDIESARAERSRLCEVTGRTDLGTRMHWLYWQESSPRTLQDAGFTYDSSFGYNNAIGFRAGTTQAFCPLIAERLFELPMNIQDSALFYSDRMKLTEDEALNACKDIIHTMRGQGGALTVNWHTRSLSPERLWGDFYAELLKEIRTYRVWFGTGQEIVEWFRKRRELTFDSVCFEENGAQVALSSSARHSEASFVVRIHNSGTVTDMPIYTDC
jgi:hypothetical protein